MTASETLHAFEANLITQAEAVEQTMCEWIDDVYERAASEGHRDNRALLREQRHGIQ